MLDFVHFCTLPSGREALRRNFNSQEVVFKPILGIKIAPEAIPIQNEEHQNVQSRVKGISCKEAKHSSVLYKEPGLSKTSFSRGIFFKRRRASSLIFAFMKDRRLSGIAPNFLT